MAINLERRDFAALSIIRLFLQVLLWGRIMSAGPFQDCYSQGQLVGGTKEGLHREWRSMGFKLQLKEGVVSKGSVLVCNQLYSYNNY